MIETSKISKKNFISEKIKNWMFGIHSIIYRKSSSMYDVFYVTGVLRCKSNETNPIKIAVER